MSDMKQTLMLADTGRATTRLGYGCSSLMGALGRRDSLALLEAAYDAGIRHFDVAPMYGFGAAEECLGEFAQRHADDVTLTTKYGILPPANRRSIMGIARRIAGPILKRIPAVKKRLASAAAAVAAPDVRASFTAEEARQSLERSLRALRTGRIDLWLLHEAEASDLKDDQLLRFLEDSAAQGKIGTFGIGSEARKIPALVSEHPAYCRVLQFEWSVLDDALPAGGPFRIHHRALTENFRQLHSSLREDTDRCRQWSQAIGADLADGEALANLMLKASLVANPSSIVLFSSKNIEHIAKNVAVAEDDALVEPARRLHAVLHQPGVPTKFAVGAAE